MRHRSKLLNNRELKSRPFRWTMGPYSSKKKRFMVLSGERLLFDPTQIVPRITHMLFVNLKDHFPSQRKTQLVLINVKYHLILC